MSYRRPTTRHLRRKVIEAARALVDLGDLAYLLDLDDVPLELTLAWRDLVTSSRALDRRRKARKRRPS